MVGMTIASPGAITADGGFKKIIGSLGSSLPNSVAWALKLRPTQTTLLGEDGVRNLTDSSENFWPVRSRLPQISPRISAIESPSTIPERAAADPAAMKRQSFIDGLKPCEFPGGARERVSGGAHERSWLRPKPRRRVRHRRRRLRPRPRTAFS